MLVDFSISNFGPFRDKVTLSMIASAQKDKSEGIIETETVKAGLLKSTVIFGPNASGKSYLFDAMDVLKAVVDGARPNGMDIPGYIPFRLSSQSISAPIEMELRMVIEGVIFTYQISFVHDRILTESLKYTPNGRSAVVFSRGTVEERLNPKIKDMLTATSTYLFVAASYNDKICNTVLKAILEIRVIHPNNIPSLLHSLKTTENDPEIKSMMESALEAADLGIIDFKVDGTAMIVQSSTNIQPLGTYVEPKIQFLHSFEDADVDKSKLSFPEDIESIGTLTMFSLMWPISLSLKHGRTLLIDEFGSSLHPMLTRWIIDLFNNEENDKGSQLIVNTHDLGLMDIDDFLRRDEIWFTNKNRCNGSCSLFSLSDFKGVKKGSDVRKDYLKGRFDGVPIVTGVRKL